MDSEMIQAFNKSLVSMQEAKGGLVSKQKVLEITKAAMNGVRYFKHVVFIIERYLAKCRQEFKVPALYVMDSILRQAKKQYKHKDVFAPRFSINLSNTVQNVLTCESADRPKVVRVVNLWQAHQIFTEEMLEPVLQHCRASGLEVDPVRVEQLVKGDKADMLLYQPQFAERGLSFNSSGGSTGVGTTLKDLPIPIIPSEQTHRIVPPPPPGPPPPSTPTGAGVAQNVHHQPSLEERLSQFKKLSSGGAPLSTMTPLATAAVPSLSRTNSVSGGTPTALGTSRSNETGPKTPPLEDQDHRFATGQLSQTTISSVEDHRPQDVGLSSMDVLQLLLTGVGALVPPDIGARPDVLTKVQRLLNERVGESLEIERRREGNIKNLLSREFDYSDEEDEAVVQHGQNPQHQQSMGPLAGVSREKMVTIAHALLGDGSFQQELRQQFAVQQQHAPFQLPDFSLPPPNIGAVINGGGGGLPKMFMSPPKMTGTSVPLPPGTSPSGAFNMAAVPPPLSLMSLATNAPSSSSNRDQSPPSSSGKRQHHHHHRERDRGERDSRDRDRDGRRRSERGSDRPSASGRKRNREWSPSVADDKDLRRSFSPPGAKRERNEDGGGGGRRNDRDKRSGGGRRERGGGRHDEEERGERGKERDQQERERRRIGLPSKPKADHVLIASRTLWFGRIPSGASESDIVDSVKDIGAPEKVSLVFGRGCAYVTMPDRRLAFKIMDRMEKSIKVQNKNVKVNWATIPYVQDNNQLMVNYWDMNQGFAQIPYTKLPPDGTVDLLMDGAWLELDTLPANLKDRYTNTGLKQQQQQQQQQLMVQQQNLMLSATAAAQQLQQATAPMGTAAVTVPQQQAVVPSITGLLPAAMFTQAAAAAAAAQMAFAGNLLPFTFPPPNLPPPPVSAGGVHQQQQQHQAAATVTMPKSVLGSTVSALMASTPPTTTAPAGAAAGLQISSAGSLAGGFANASGFGIAGFAGSIGGGGGGGSGAGGGRGQWTPRGRGGARGGGGSGFQPRFSSSSGGFRPGGFQSGDGGGRGGRGGFRGGRGRGWDGGGSPMGRGARGGRGGRGGFYSGGRPPFGDGDFGTGANREPFGFGALPPQSESEGNVPASSNHITQQKREIEAPPGASDSYASVGFGDGTKFEPKTLNAPPGATTSGPFANLGFAGDLPKLESMFGGQLQQQQHHHCSETETDAPPGLD